MRAYVLAIVLIGIPMRPAHAKGGDDSLLAECLDKDVTSERAVVACEKACKLGSGRGCFETGALVYHASKPDAKKARRLFEKGCQLHELLACSDLGLMVVKGLGGPADVARGNALLTDACEKNESGACSELGNSYNMGRGVKANPEKFVELQRRSCKLGNPIACSTLDSNGLAR